MGKGADDACCVSSKSMLGTAAFFSFACFALQVSAGAGGSWATCNNFDFGLREAFVQRGAVGGGQIAASWDDSTERYADTMALLGKVCTAFLVLGGMASVVTIAALLCIKPFDIVKDQRDMLLLIGSGMQFLFTLVVMILYTSVAKQKLSDLLKDINNKLSLNLPGRVPWADPTLGSSTYLLMVAVVFALLSAIVVYYLRQELVVDGRKQKRVVGSKNAIPSGGVGMTLGGGGMGGGGGGMGGGGGGMGGGGGGMGGGGGGMGGSSMGGGPRNMSQSQSMGGGAQGYESGGNPFLAKAFGGIGSQSNLGGMRMSTLEANEGFGVNTSFTQGPGQYRQSDMPGGMGGPPGLSRDFSNDGNVIPGMGGMEGMGGGGRMGQATAGMQLGSAGGMSIRQGAPMFNNAGQYNNDQQYNDQQYNDQQSGGYDNGDQQQYNEYSRTGGYGGGGQQGDQYDQQGGGQQYTDGGGGYNNQQQQQNYY